MPIDNVENEEARKAKKELPDSWRNAVTSGGQDATHMLIYETHNLVEAATVAIKKKLEYILTLVTCGFDKDTSIKNSVDYTLLDE